MTPDRTPAQLSPQEDPCVDWGTGAAGSSSTPILNFEILFKKIDELYESTDENIIGVEYGFKVKEGITTSEKCISFLVQKKKPISELSPSEILPDKVILPDGVALKTDVKQGKVFALGCEEFSTWQDDPPSNRNKVRPIKGGLSITNSTVLDGYMGTLGFLAIDASDGALVGVSNAHVLVDDMFLASDRNSGGQQTNVVFHNVVQPAEDGDLEANVIGKVKKYVPFVSNGNHYVDGAVCTIRESVVNLASSSGQHELSISQHLDFASSAEINNLLSSDPDLFSSGATTGAKGEGSVKLKIESIGSVINVEGYLKQGVSQVVKFSGLLSFVATDNPQRPLSSQCLYPISPGDSGSALIADFNGIKKIIGLVFAGAIDENGDCIRGYACRIDSVANELCLLPWTNNDSVKFNEEKVALFTSQALAGSKCATVNGETYHQLGSYSSPSSAGFEIEPEIGDCVNGDPVAGCCGLGPSPSPSPSPPSPPPSPSPSPSPSPCDNGGGSQGDVHYFSSAGGSAGISALIFRDENYYGAGSHWVIEWVEINQQDQVSAILTRRSSANMFQTTSSNTKFYVYGNPIGVNYTLVERGSMYGFSYSPVESTFSEMLPELNELKYIGGMYVEFLRQNVREGAVFSPRLDQIGRNKSFVMDDRWRLVSGGVDLSPVEVVDNRYMQIDTSTLIPAFKNYIKTLTGNNSLLSANGISPFLSIDDFKTGNIERNESFGQAPNPLPPAIYPMFLNNLQSNALMVGHREVIAQSSGSDPSSWVDGRAKWINANLASATFTCQECISEEFAPVIDPDGSPHDCSTSAGAWMAALKMETDRQPIQPGSAQDCRCCGGASENYYWDDSAFCGRSESLCLPLAVIENGINIGFSNYGFEYKVVPFFANKNNEMGGIKANRVSLLELPYVINGKLLTGKFHYFKHDPTPDPNSYPKSYLESFGFDVSGVLTNKVLIANNSFREGLDVVRIY